MPPTVIHELMAVVREAQAQPEAGVDERNIKPTTIVSIDCVHALKGRSEIVHSYISANKSN